MDTHTKQILNEYGYETWASQPEPDDYKISKEKLDRTHKAILQKRKDNLARDVASYEAMRARLPPGPPGREMKL